MGTGNAFSLLPAYENATGNWIKIVQRVPVEVSFLIQKNSWNILAYWFIDDSNY